MKLHVPLTALLLLGAVPATFAVNNELQQEGNGTRRGVSSLTDAHDAWAQGDYIAALNSYIAILNAPGGDAHLDEIALQTGELYRSVELTTDGRNPRFSADGRYIAYDTGL